MTHDWVFVCTECESDQIVDPYKNVWVQQGQTPPCKLCGGVVIYVEHARDRDAALAKNKVKRGIAPNPKGDEGPDVYVPF